MQDSELKKLLLETCPVRPGQEDRAWAVLRERLAKKKVGTSSWNWLYFPTWRSMAVTAAVVALVLIPLLEFFAGAEAISVATANSQLPGIYATAFYSRPAQAQVVWLNGMEPASDKPTYLDPTTVISTKHAAQPAGDPNSL
jgi:hypothetical protein